MANLRKEARGRECQVRLPGICNGNPETVVLAHYRMVGICGTGMKPDDLRIPVAFEEAKKAGMEFTIANKELKNAHPNTSRVIMENADGRRMVIQAYSIGGGRIRVSNLDGIEVDFSGESNTLIVRNQDRPGCITEVSAALSKEKINVATMQVFRHKRGGSAVMVVETDQPIPQNVVSELKKKEDILEVISLNLEERGA